jgi:hypothetical protein
MTVRVAYDNDQIEYEFYAPGVKDVLIELDRWPSFRSAVEQWLGNYPKNKHFAIFLPIVSAQDGSGDA